MNLRKYVLAVLAVFGFIFVFDMIFHGIFLADFYEQTQSLWRPKGEYVMPMMIFGQMLFALMFVLIFTFGYQKQGMIEGVRYGALIGLLLIPNSLILYAVQPLPEVLAALWVIGAMVEMILAGAIAASVYRS